MICYSSHTHTLAREWSDDFRRLWQLPFDSSKGSSVSLSYIEIVQSYPMYCFDQLRTLTNTFSKFMKHTKTSFWNFLHFCSNTFIQNSASLVPIPLRKPNCVWFHSYQVWIRLCITHNRIFKVWLIKLIRRKLEHLFGLHFCGSSTNVDGISPDW